MKLTERAPRLHYRENSLNAVQGDNHLIYTVDRTPSFFFVTESGR